MAQSPWLKSVLLKDVDIQGINLLFSSRRGHLFLQTDQPIYNPGQRGESQPRRLSESALQGEGCLGNVCSPLAPAPAPEGCCSPLTLHSQFGTGSSLWTKRCAHPRTPSRSLWR